MTLGPLLLLVLTLLAGFGAQADFVYNGFRVTFGCIVGHNDLLSKFNVSTVQECIDKCIDHKKCQSLDFGRKRSSKDEGVPSPDGYCWLSTQTSATAELSRPCYKDDTERFYETAERVHLPQTTKVAAARHHTTTTPPRQPDTTTTTTAEQSESSSAAGFKAYHHQQQQQDVPAVLDVGGWTYLTGRGCFATSSDYYVVRTFPFTHSLETCAYFCSQHAQCQSLQYSPERDFCQLNKRTKGDPSMTHLWRSTCPVTASFAQKVGWHGDLPMVPGEHKSAQLGHPSRREPKTAAETAEEQKKMVKGHFGPRMAACIRAHNDFETLRGIESFDECQVKCLGDSTCRSIEYRQVDKMCQRSTATRVRVGADFTSPCFLDQPKKTGPGNIVHLYAERIAGSA